jgi:hypothetical protein
MALNLLLCVYTLGPGITGLFCFILKIHDQIFGDLTHLEEVTSCAKHTIILRGTVENVCTVFAIYTQNHKSF